MQIVIDTTGSMGDEIAYLNAEFDALTTTIQTKFPNADQRWSIVAYKDKNDSYVVLPTDFSADLTGLHQKLAALSASGGGDTPEAPEQALAAGANLSWRTGARCRARDLLGGRCPASRRRRAPR